MKKKPKKQTNRKQNIKTAYVGVFVALADQSADVLHQDAVDGLDVLALVFDDGAQLRPAVAPHAVLVVHHLPKKTKAKRYYINIFYPQNEKKN